MADNFQSHAKGLDAPADKHFTITPSDTVALDPKPRSLYCQTAGNVAIKDAAGTSLTYAVTAGQVLPFRAAHVLATGTTATVYGWE